MSENGHGVQVVTVENDHSYKLNVAELEEVLMKPEIKDLPVVVISVAGAYRSGKSFLLNLFLKYLEAPAEDRLNGKWLETDDEPLTGFSWRGGSTRDTTGILLWSESFIATMSNGDKFAVLIMDTKVTFDTTSSMKDCSTVFALSTLLSSVQIYNLSNKIQEVDLQHLQLLIEYGKLLKDKSGKPFQVLEFLVRDWWFPYEYPYGAEGGQLYLDAKLEITPNMLKELKDLRQHIRSSFESVTCFLMPHPGFGVLKADFKGSVKGISPVFLNALKKLVPSLFSEAKLKVKQVNGQPVKTKELFEYFKTYINLFNNGKIPSPTTILEATSEAGFLLAVKEARELYERNMTETCFGDGKSVPAHDVQLIHRREVSNALALFNDKKKLGSNADSSKYLDILTKGLNLREHEYFIINAGKTQKAIHDAKAAYEEEVDSIAKGRPLCVHALDLQKVHDEALRAALNKFDGNRKKLSEDIDPDRKSLEKDLSRRLMLLRITNEQNNTLAKADLKEEYWQHMMVKVLVKPSLNEDQFTEEHKKAMKRALEQFEARRSMSNEYLEDIYKFDLQMQLEHFYIILKEINNSAIKDSFQIALSVFNAIIMSISEGRKLCLHPQALREVYDEAVCAALKAFRPNRSCGQGFNKSDRDEALILSIFKNRFEALDYNNNLENEIAVHTSFEWFKSKYKTLSGPSWSWLLIVPIFQTRNHYDEAKEFGLKVFWSKRRGNRHYVEDTYKTDLENQMWNWYNS